MPCTTLGRIAAQRRVAGEFERRRTSLVQTAGTGRHPRRRRAAAGDTQARRADVAQALFYTLLLCTNGAARQRMPGSTGRVHAHTTVAQVCHDASVGAALPIDVAAATMRVGAAGAAASVAIVRGLPDAVSDRGARGRGGLANGRRDADAPVPDARRARRSTHRIKRQAPTCAGIPDEALSIPIGRAAERDMRFVAELHGAECAPSKRDEPVCASGMLQLGGLLDEARLRTPSQVAARLKASAGLRAAALAFMAKVRGAAAAVVSADALDEVATTLLANQLVMHSWARYIRHSLLSSRGGRVRLADPLAAVEAAAQLAGCEPANCAILLAPDSPARRQATLVAMLALALSRHDRLDKPTGTSAEGGYIVPASVGLDDAALVFPMVLTDAVRYAHRELALVVNPLPQLPGDSTIRSDGACYRGATGRSHMSDAALLDQARPYGPVRGCQVPPHHFEPVDWEHPVGTLAHSMRSILNLYFNAEAFVPAKQYERLHLAESLRQTIETWQGQARRTSVHPGWLTALHLAYSNGIEPLSMPQLRGFWQQHLFPRYRAELNRFRDDAGDRSPWLSERLGLLPPLSETPSDHDLVAWMEFLRDDLRQHIASLDGSRQEAEKARLVAWRLPWPQANVLFYRTPAEHFHIIATHFVNRMQALLVEPHLWHVIVAESAASVGDRSAFNDATAWFNDLAKAGDDETPSLRTAQIGGDPKASGLRTAMQRFRSRLLKHPAFLANAAEVLREEQKPGTPVSILARAQSLTGEAEAPPSTIHHVFSVGTLLGMLPVVGTMDRLAKDVVHGDLINGLIDGVDLYMQVTDVYGTAASVLFSDEVTSCFEQQGAQLAEDDLREATLHEERRVVRMVRRGAVYREIERTTGAIVDDGAVIVRNGRQLQRLVLREAGDAVQTLARLGFTARITADLIGTLGKYTGPERSFEQAFGRVFEFDASSPESLRAEAGRAYAFYYRNSPTFRRLLNAVHADVKPWVVQLREGTAFRTVFAADDALEQNRVHLGGPADAEKMVYMGVTGLQRMPYRRALLHEAVHAMTGLPDTSFDLHYKKQIFAVRRLAGFLDGSAAPTPTQAEPPALDSIMSDVHARRRRTLQRKLRAAQAVIDDAILGRAQQRGPVVYIVDRIAQEAASGWEERVMYLADTEDTGTRMNLMEAQRAAATTRMHHENDRLDRLWVDSLEMAEDVRLGLTVRVAQRALVREWQQFVSLFKSRDDYPVANWMDHYLQPAVFDVAPEVETVLKNLVRDASRISPTFKKLIRMWYVFSPSSTIWTFTTRQGRTSAMNVDPDTIDLSEERHIVTSVGAQPASVRRRAICGMVESLLGALGFKKPEGLLSEARWLGNALEQRVLDELFDDEPLRLNGAVLTRNALSSAVDASLSVLRRAALIEDRYVEARISPPERRGSSGWV